VQVIQKEKATSLVQLSRSAGLCEEAIVRLLGKKTTTGGTLYSGGPL